MANQGVREDDSLLFLRKSVKSDKALYYGCNFDDVEFVHNIIYESKPNNDKSAFPDFICVDTAIEHFEVTSMFESKKGSAFKQDVAATKRKVGEDAVWGLCLSDCSREYLVKSIKRQFAKHLQSVNKHLSNFDKVMFVIDARAEIFVRYCERIPDKFDGMKFGDLKSDVLDTGVWRPSRDADILDYFYEHRDLVQYVVYQNLDVCEVIKCDCIPLMKELLTHHFNYGYGTTEFPVQGTTACGFVFGR